MLTTKLTAIADAIRDKLGITAQLDLDDMATAVGSLKNPTGTKTITANGTVDVANYASADVAVPQDHTAEDGIVSRGLSGAYVNNRVTVVGTSAFRGAANITSVEFQHATSIQSYALASTTALSSAKLPIVTEIRANAFNGSGVGEISFDDITAVPTLQDANAFANCSSLTSLWFPDSLVSQAKTTTNWSTYSSKIKPLSEKPTS